jgi:hypothetical protein
LQAADKPFKGRPVGRNRWLEGAGTITGAGAGILDRERTIATAGFNRWMVPPAALCIHLCIGMAYGFSAGRGTPAPSGSY